MIEHDHVFTFIVKGDDALVDADHVARHAYAAIFGGGEDVQQILGHAEIICCGRFSFLSKKVSPLHISKIISILLHHCNFLCPAQESEMRINLCLQE